MVTYRMKGVKSVEAKLELWHGDYLELMKDIPDGSIVPIIQSKDKDSRTDRTERLFVLE